MKLVECAGSPFKIGCITGESLRHEIQSHLEIKARQIIPEYRLAILAKTLEHYLPDVLEEIKGTSEGANVSVNEILKLNFEPYPDDMAIDDGCTNIIFKNGPDGPIWGKNNDGYGPESLPVCVRKIIPDHGIPVIIFTFCGTVAATDGMNAEGVAVGHSSVGSVFQQSDQHVPIRLWAYYALTKSHNTKEFASHIISTPLRGKGYSHVCIDRSGVMCSIEAACPLVQIRKGASLKAMNCVNHYQLKHLAEADCRTPECKQNSLARQKFLDHIFENEVNFDLKTMKSLLRHHGSPSICGHGGNDLLVTKFSMIGLPRQNKVLYLYGKPCENNYKEIML